MITKLKADGEHDYLKQVPIHTLQNSLANLLEAYKRFFKGLGGFPKFKSKHESKQSFTVVFLLEFHVKGKAGFETGLFVIRKTLRLLDLRQRSLLPLLRPLFLLHLVQNLRALHRRLS